MIPIQGVGDRWLAGESIPGVEFALHDTVELVGGPLDGERGSIALLMGLTPEPSYLVSMSRGRDVRQPQGALRRADPR